MCMWSPWRWEGCEHCVPVNLCKWGFLLMAGLWLCTNGCRCVDGGRTSPVTVLISGCGHGGQLHDSAPTGGHNAFADNSTSLVPPRDGKKGMEGKRGGVEEENPHALNMNLMRKALCHRWRLHPDWAECSSLARKLASEVLGIWIMKMRAKSSASSYRNPDCLRLSEHQKRHWQRDIVILKSKLTPGAPASSVTARHRATAWMENTAHGFDWTAAGIIRHFSSNSRDIICHFSFHSNRANECSLAHIQSWTSLQLLILKVEIIRNGFVSLVILSYFFLSLFLSVFLSLNGSALREKSPHECIRES